MYSLPLLRVDGIHEYQSYWGDILLNFKAWTIQKLMELVSTSNILCCDMITCIFCILDHS